MQKKIYNIDCGKGFGMWSDNISKLMYFESIKDILSKITIPANVADFGGANGILKKFIPHIITIDIDETKNPDIIDNIITHRGDYDLIIARFVLHYLNDYEVLEFFKNLKQYHTGKILIIQFTNEDLKSKYANSQNEFKYFRTNSQLINLLPECKEIYSITYTCTPEFYKNRLGIDDAVCHVEEIKAFLI